MKRETIIIGETDPLNERLMPHSIEAEQGVLGCILLDYQKCRAVAMEFLLMGVVAFYDDRHQTIFETMVATTGYQDMITFSQKLRDKSCLETVGGLAYLSSLQDVTPSATNIVYYLEIVVEKWRLRELYKQSLEVKEMVYGGTPAAEIQAKSLGAGRAIFNATLKTKSVLQLSREVVDEMAAKIAGQLPPLLKTGIRSVDRIIEGIGKDVVVVGARPSIGKTSMLLTISYNLMQKFVRPEQRILFISAESDPLKLTKRLTEITCRASLRQSPEYIKEHFAAYQEATVVVGKMPIVFDWERSMRIDRACAKAVAESQNSELVAVVVDYLGKFQTEKEHNNSKYKVAEVMEKFCGLRDHLGVPVFMGVQLSREAEDERPTMRMLADASEVERDADTVMLLHHSKRKEEKDYPTWSCQVIVDKSREGQTGTADAIFRKYCGVWEDVPFEPWLPFQSNQK